MVFVFPDDATLQFALTGGLVPPAISLAPARIGRDSEDRLWIQPTGPLSKTLPATLQRVGVSLSDQASDDGEEVDHWLQAMPLIRDSGAAALTEQTPVLFELSDPA